MSLRIGRHEHHILASLVASRDKEGIPVSDEEASSLVGYSPATVNNLRGQKAFKDLVRHYAGLDGPPNVPDPLERMRALGLSTLEELQARLIDDPDSFTKRELLDMTELLLVKAATLSPRGVAARPDGGVRVAIQFVEAKHKELEHVPAEPSTVVADRPLGAEVRSPPDLAALRNIHAET